MRIKVGILNKSTTQKFVGNYLSQIWLRFHIWHYLGIQFVKIFIRKVENDKVDQVNILLCSIYYKHLVESLFTIELEIILFLGSRKNGLISCMTAQLPIVATVAV